MSEPVYRDLAADYAQKNYGKPCDHCAKPIGTGAYSLTDGHKFCSKRCMLLVAGIDFDRIREEGLAALERLRKAARRGKQARKDKRQLRANRGQRIP